MLFTNDLDMSRGQRLADANGELIELLARAGYPWIDETVHARRDDHALISPAGR
jgi:hypothetical protein